MKNCCQEIYPDCDLRRWETQPTSYIADADLYYTKLEIDTKLEDIVESGCCITPQEVDEKIDAAISGIDLSNYALKSEIPTVPTKVSAFENDVPYLTEHQSLSGYATEQWVEDKHYITSVDLSDYALKSEIPTVPTSNSAFTNDMQFITYTDLIGYINSLQSQITALNIALNECCGGSGDTGDTSDGKLFVRYQNNTTKTLECGIENNVSFEDYKPYYNLVEENVIEQGDIATITYAKVGDCVTVIRNSAFSGCTSLSKIDLPFDSLNNNTQYSASSIDDAAFANTAIQSVGLQGDSTTSVQLPSAYTQVASELFSGCTALTTVELGANVEKIQMHSFKGCTNLQSITLHRTSGVTIIYDRYLGTDSLSDVGNNTFVVYVPSELVNTYKAADGWNNYASRIQAIP